MSKLSTTVSLMDSRLAVITVRLNELSDRQERVEESLKLLHSSVRGLQPLTLQPPQPHPQNTQPPEPQVQAPQPHPQPHPQNTQPPKPHVQAPQPHPQPHPQNTQPPQSHPQTVQPPQQQLTLDGDFLSAVQLINIRTASSSRRNLLPKFCDNYLRSKTGRRTMSVERTKNSWIPRRLLLYEELPFSNIL